ncbi:MAG: ATP-binding protein [Spirosomataceae bacterium]
MTEKLVSALINSLAVALLGSRQVGKTTLALEIAESVIKKPILYLDLELDSDRIKLQDAESYLEQHRDELLIIDEVQLMPQLFKTLRGLIDRRTRAGEPSAQFLLLGSASRELLQQTSQTLAGRIRYLELTPFTVNELITDNPENYSVNKHWFRGGFPQSYLAANDDESWNWRTDFISTYVERDIPRLGINIAATRMRRFWTMLAHFHGQQINKSSLGKSLEVSHTTIQHYLDTLTDLYMLRQLVPWSGNTKKRLVKSPKIYVRDSGLLHRLLGIAEFDDLLGNPVLGHSWEGFVIENICSRLPDKWQTSYYRTAEQSEIDLILEKTNERWAVEIKRGLVPKVNIGFHRASEDIKATKKWVIYGGNERFSLGNDTEAISLVEFLSII